jgi:hypothetical protein
VKPRFSRFLAIGSPIAPRPTNAIVVMVRLLIKKFGKVERWSS